MRLVEVEHDDACRIGPVHMLLGAGDGTGNGLARLDARVGIDMYDIGLAHRDAPPGSEFATSLRCSALVQVGHDLGERGARHAARLIDIGRGQRLDQLAVDRRDGLGQRVRTAEDGELDGVGHFCL